jgi:hypothetical protein
MLFLIWTQFSCSSGNESVVSKEDVPQFILTDSLIIGYLGNLRMIDIKSNRSEYLMHDYQRKEFLRIDSDGKIILSKDLSSDGKDSFGDYFYSANYYEEDKILIFSYPNGVYTYDLEFNLLNKENLAFNINTNSIGSGLASYLVGDKLFTNRRPENQSEGFFSQDDYLARFPFLTVYDLEKKKIISEQYIPKETQLILHPGKYRETAPHSIILGDVIYLLFYYSPEIYRFSFPDLAYLGKLDLDPSEKYVQVKPGKVGDAGFEQFINELAGSEFIHFSASNEYLITGYRGAAPQDKVDALPKNIVGGKPFNDLVKEYKIPYYQIIKGVEKLWEGHIDVRFGFKGGYLFAKRDIHQPVVEVEKDYVVFYFYKIE